MKAYTVYLDTHTGRNQVSLEADEHMVTNDLFEFKRKGAIVAVFVRAKTFGFVEEEPPAEEGPGFVPGI